MSTKDKLRKMKDDFMNALKLSRKVDNYSERFNRQLETDENIRNKTECSWIRKRILKTVVLDALANRISFTGDAELVKKINDNLSMMKLWTTLQESCFESRLMGGAVVVLGIEDGGLSTDAVNVKKIRNIIYATMIPIEDLTVTKFTTNIADKNYKQPEFYLIGSQSYHYSRVLKFVGEPYYKPEQVKGFGISIMKQVEEAVKTLGLTISGLEDIILEMTFKVLGIPMLSKIMEATDETSLADAVAVIKTRMELINNTMTTDGLLVKDIDETFEKPIMNATGIEPILKFVMQYVSAAANMPLTKLWGQQLGTLAGAVETTGDWQDNVRNYQESLTDELDKFFEYVVAMLNNGVIPDDFDWTWNSSRSESNQEKVDRDTKFNEALVKMFDSGIIGLDEARTSIMNGSRHIEIDPDFMPEPTPDENK